MWTKRIKEWPDNLLHAQIEGTIAKLDRETNEHYKIGLKNLLDRLLAERSRRNKVS
jgi:hypothetical protein